MVVGHGAFELCLPSLGFLFTKLVLRRTISGRTPQLTWSWGEEGRTFDGMICLQHYEVSTFGSDIYYGCIGHSLTHITPGNRIRMIVAYNPIYGRGWQQLVMGCRPRTLLVLPTLTNARHQTKCTMSQGGRDAYQTLPESVLVVRIALVF